MFPIMTFTTLSLFFGGLTASAIPVLLHLIMQGKPKQIEFPALMFITKHLEAQRRSFQLKHILLLLLRIFAFVLFGLALARPMLKLGDWFGFAAVSGGANNSSFVSQIAASLGSQDAPVAVAIVVDTSLRMEYVSENKTRLDTAKEFARWILRQLPQNSTVAVLSSARETAVFQVDQLAAEEKVARLRITPLGRPISEAVKDAFVLLNDNPLDQRELYVISDLSMPGWLESRSLDTGEGDTGIFVVDVSAKEPNNSSIRRFSLIPETITAQSPIRLDIEVAHHGSPVKKTVELVLIGSKGDPNAETVRMSKSVDFSDGDSRHSVSMTLTGFEPGTIQGKLRFSNHDALPMDDQSWFTLQVQTPWKMLLLAQPPVRDSSLYLQEALATVPFEVETAPLSELPGMTLAELQGYSGVVLLDPSPLMPVVWKKLADYAAAGYGVGLFLGPHADSLASFNDPAATEVLGTKLVRQARVPSGELWIVPGVSPIFSPFRSVGTLEQFPWSSQSVFRYWEFGDFSHRAEIAAPFSDHRGAIVAQTMGRGHTVTVATPVSELSDVSKPWNLLTRGDASWMFVLLAEGIAKYMIGVGEQKFNFNVGEPVVLRPNMSKLPASCLLGTPGGASIRLTPDPVKREIAVPATAESGNYRLRSGGANETLDTGFSANIPAGETDLKKIDKAKLDQFFGANKYRLVQTPQEIEQGIARRRIGQELYAAVMMLLALVFVTEYVFANRFYR
jgi:hypothetical protein